MHQQHRSGSNVDSVNASWCLMSHRAQVILDESRAPSERLKKNCFFSKMKTDLCFSWRFHMFCPVRKVQLEFPIYNFLQWHCRTDGNTLQTATLIGLTHWNKLLRKKSFVYQWTINWTFHAAVWVGLHLDLSSGDLHANCQMPPPHMGHKKDWGSGLQVTFKIQKTRKRSEKIQDCQTKAQAAWCWRHRWFAVIYN